MAQPAGDVAAARRRWMLPLLAIVVALAGVMAVIAVAAGVGRLGDARGEPVPARFVEEAASGIDHAYVGDWPFVVGGGVAVFDCDDDRRPDLYLAGGASPAALYRNRSVVGGAIQFTEEPDPVTALADVTGAYPLDLDGDGRVDLAVLRRGEEVLLRGLGDCRFERANEAFGLPSDDDLTTAFSATWEDDASLPTLALGNYTGIDAFGHWDGTCIDSTLVRPRAGETRYDAPIALSPGWCTLSMLFSDWDRSGRRDLRVSNDRHYYTDGGGGQEQLWRVAPGERPSLYGADDGWKRLRIFGMGIASQDLTGDGMPEVYLTSQADQKLQTLADGPGQPAYEDAAFERGVTATTPFTGDDILPSTGWHDEFDDVNDDGFVDLFVAKGNVDEVPDNASRDPSNLLLGRPDGTFVESAEQAGVLNFARGRGAALTDLNLDGMLDLVLVNRRDAARVWRNVGTGSGDEPARIGHWLGIDLEQPGPNRDAIGAWIAVRAGDRVVEREVTIGGGHGGGELGPIHIGLGPAATAEVRVQWPDGEIGPWQTVAADQYVTIERGAAAPTPWTLPEG